MAKPELGTKRVCPVTGRKFYDLNKNPVISPYTGEVVPIAPVPVSRSHTSISRTLVTRNDYPREALTEAILRFIEEDLDARGK